MYYAFPLPDGTLSRPGGRPGRHAIPRQAVELTEAQFQQLTDQPRSLRLQAGAVVAVTAAERLEKAKAGKLRALAAERARRERAGMPYTFPDSAPGTVQLKQLRDVLNVNGVAATGGVLQDRGVTTADQVLSDQEGRQHALTPTQSQDLGLAVSDWVSKLYGVAWQHSDAIKALASVEEVEAYDETSGWGGA